MVILFANDIINQQKSVQKSSIDIALTHLQLGLCQTNKIMLILDMILGIEDKPVILFSYNKRFKMMIIDF